MTSTEYILSKLSDLKTQISLTGDSIKFYISTMDFWNNKMTSKFQSSDIDDVVQYLFDKSLTTSIMTVQKVGRNEICIILKNEDRCETNITDVVIEAISSFS